MVEALIEFSRNVLGVADADTAENASGSHNIVITPIYCALPAAGVPRRDGAEAVRPVAGTLLARLCGQEPLTGALFQPQLRSAFGQPHPIVLGLLRAALERC